MRTVFWASAFLIALYSASANAKPSVALPSGGTISASVLSGKTRLEIRTAKGTRYVLNVKRDATVSPKIAPSQVKIVGEIEGTAIVFIDAYPSIPGGMSLCQAGEERFLRVVTILKKTVTETFRIKLESCRDNIELASPGVEWDSASSMLKIHWLQGPDQSQKPGERIFDFSRTGRGANGKIR